MSRAIERLAGLVQQAESRTRAQKLGQETRQAADRLAAAEDRMRAADRHLAETRPVASRDLEKADADEILLKELTRKLAGLLNSLEPGQREAVSLELRLDRGPLADGRDPPLPHGDDRRRSRIRFLSDQPRKVALPSSLPEFFAAVRISVPGAITGALLAEWLAVGGGIGGAVGGYIAGAQFSAVWTAVVLVTGTALILYNLVQIVESVVLARMGMADRS